MPAVFSDGDQMNDTTEKECEAIMVLRDVIVLVYDDICKIKGKDSDYILSLYMLADDLAKRAMKDLGLSDEPDY